MSTQTNEPRGLARVVAAYKAEAAGEKTQTTTAPNKTTGLARVVAAYKAEAAQKQALKNPAPTPAPKSQAFTAKAKASPMGTGFNFASVRASATLSHADIRRLIASKSIDDHLVAKDAIEALSDKDPEAYKLAGELFDAMAPSNYL
jgi:hypothetical protein